MENVLVGDRVCIKVVFMNDLGLVLFSCEWLGELVDDVMCFGCDFCEGKGWFMMIDELCWCIEVDLLCYLIIWMDFIGVIFWVYLMVFNVF